MSGGALDSARAPHEVTDSSVASHNGDREEGRSLPEKVTLITSITIVLGLFGFMTYFSLTAATQPPQLRAEANLDEGWRANESYFVPIRVSNDGDRAAGTVEIQAELRVGEDIETSQFSIMTLPGDGSETGVVAFSRDPRDGDLTVRVASYVE